MRESPLLETTTSWSQDSGHGGAKSSFSRWGGQSPDPMQTAPTGTRHSYGDARDSKHPSSGAREGPPLPLTSFSAATFPTTERERDPNLVATATTKPEFGRHATQVICRWKSWVKSIGSALEASREPRDGDHPSSLAMGSEKRKRERKMDNYRVPSKGICISTPRSHGA